MIGELLELAIDGMVITADRKNPWGCFAFFLVVIALIAGWWYIKG